MRNLVSLAMVTLIFVSMAPGCRKDKTDDELKLHLSSRTTMRGEPVTAWVTGHEPDTDFEWSIGQSYYTSFIDSRLEKAGVAFTGAGKFWVQVSLTRQTESTPYAVLKDTIHVSDIMYEPRVDSTGIHSAGSEIILQPGVAPDSALVLMASTRSDFNCLNAYLFNNNNREDGKINLTYLNVWLPDAPACVEGKGPARNVFYTQQFFRDGDYPVSITLNNIVYSGTLKVSGYMSKFEFVWPHTSGVLIEPKSLIRN
jgi:hypothetical protein